MIKRLLAIIITLVIVLCVAFECSLNASAVIGVDDAVVITGLALGLASVGVTVINFSNFVTSDQWASLSSNISSSIMNGCHTVASGGKLLLKMSKVAWNSLTGWVKSKFSGANETKNVEVETTVEAPPRTLTLSDGGVVPYGDFMEYNFLIFKSLESGNYIGLYCTAPNCGAQFLKTTIQFYCVGSGYKVCRVDCINGSWTDIGRSNMTYGITFRGQTGSIYNYSFSSNYDTRPESFSLYRTIDRVTSTAGNIDTSYPPAEVIPDEPETVIEQIAMKSEGAYYPNAVESPAETIKDGEYMVFTVPDSIVADAGTNNATITTDTTTLINGLSQVVPESVNPRVQTNSYGQTSTVDEILSDTPSAELDGTNAGSAEADIETANKFRLPRSFLEGFPFSIPYSIYLGLQTFIADPEAPSFDLPFSIPRLGIDETVRLDLAQFNPLARVCRAFLSLVWVAGLAMACNAWIKR